MREQTNIAAFQGLTNDSHKAWMGAVRSDEAIWPSVEFIGVLGTGLVIIVGGALVLNESLTVGFIIAFINLLMRFYDPIEDVFRIDGIDLRDVPVESAQPDGCCPAR